MRKFIKPLLLCFVILGVGLAAIFFFRMHINQETGEKVYMKPAVRDKDAEEKLNELVDSKLKELTLDQKIAQLLIVEAPSLTIDEKLTNQMQTAPYGGFILMGNAFGTLEETRKFIQDLRDLNSIPLIISTDHEGGTVQRPRKITSPQATNFPLAAVLGDIDSTSLAMDVGAAMGRELSAIGINVDYAPVLDVNSNPKNPVISKRSFSSNPRKVAEIGKAFAEGLEKSCVTPVFKHFPGHGDTSVDSHVNLPIVNKTREELDAIELVPFKDAINNGAEIIMVAHIALPEITGNNTPATMSYKITTELLRDELGYKGLIITDGVNMGALAKNYPEADIYYRVIEAGADLVLLPSNPDLAIASIKEHIPEERINESVRRILYYKYGSMQSWKLLDASNFASAENQAVIERVNSQASSTK